MCSHGQNPSVHSGGIAGNSSCRGMTYRCLPSQKRQTSSLSSMIENKKEEKPRKSRIAEPGDMVQVVPSELFNVDPQVGDVELRR